MGVPVKRDTFWRDCALFVLAVIVSIVVSWIVAGAITEVLSGA